MKNICIIKIISVPQQWEKWDKDNHKKDNHHRNNLSEDNHNSDGHEKDIFLLLHNKMAK